MTYEIVWRRLRDWAGPGHDVEEERIQSPAKSLEGTLASARALIRELKADGWPLQSVEVHQDGQLMYPMELEE